jgi:hypothetical protein
MKPVKTSIQHITQEKNKWIILSFLFFVFSVLSFSVNTHKTMCALSEEPAKCPWPMPCFTKDSVIYSYATLCFGYGLACVPQACPPPPN